MSVTKWNGYTVTVLVAVILAALWAWHFLRGVPDLRLAWTFLGAALLWVIVRADWIVTVKYSSMYSPPWGEYRSYRPPKSPLWQPLKPRGSSWLDAFDAGGWGGPIGKPRLSLQWEMVTGKLMLVTVLGYVAGRLFTIMRRP